MNWLAHLVLSEPSPAFRIGNLLPDILSALEMGALGGEFRRGIDCHRAIDRFTDAHPVVRRSIRRIEPPFRRYGGILIDVFYDHYLACGWSDYCEIPLPEFVGAVQASFEAQRGALPLLAYARLQQIKAGGWLASYQDLGGVRRALEGIGARLRRPCELGRATAQLEIHYEALRQDFREFFPELRAYVATLS